MSETQKSVRLSKAAKEFNLGMVRISEFLASKGFEIEAKPNTKIDSAMYTLLEQAFASDKQLKEKSMRKTVGQEEHETVTIETAVKPVRKVQEEEEVIIKNVQSIDEAPIIKAKAEQEVKVKVVSKIVLEEKKPKKTVTKKEGAEVKKEKKPKTDPAPTAEPPPAPAPAPAPETVRAKAETLSGPTVVGKIDLPDKPIASSNDDTNLRKKRKRKRIDKPKVDVAGISRGAPSSKDKRRPTRKVKPDVSEKDIQKEIKETLARLSGSGKSKSSKLRRAKREAVALRTEDELKRAEEDKSVIRITEFVTVSDLGVMMNVSPTEIISACMTLGIFASINQRLDAETIKIIAEEFGYTVEFTTAEVQESILVEQDNEEDLITRSPIITVMGHVDHGKTSLLDHIRKANVIAGEAGGITQHIGAYSVQLDNGRKITFLDTPGHEAFTAMRARGAQVTDLAIIVVAADDNVMPQTVEAINHAQAAGIPMIFAINKIDKAGANPEKIKEELAGMNYLVEDWGGKYQSQDISAKNGTNVEELLEKVLVEADLLDLKANPNKNAVGTVIESSLDKGRGYVTTLLVESGTLKVGDNMVAGCHYGKIKAMNNERGKAIEEVGPSMPVSILGMNGAPNAGDNFNVLDDEREAKSIANKRMQLQREQGVRTQKHITLDEIGRRIAVGDFKELNVILKGDVDGSIEALSDSLQKLSTEQIQVNIIHKGVGQISESDVLLASASDAIIIGFQVRPSSNARKLAEKEEIQIKLYSVIYSAIEEVRDAMEGMLSEKIEEKILGTAEIRDIFKISKVGTIAGCFVLEGKISRNRRVRIIRDGIVVYTGSLGSLKRFKDDVKEVTHGYECGLNIENFNDIKAGDHVESFEEVSVKQTLA